MVYLHTTFPEDLVSFQKTLSSSRRPCLLPGDLVVFVFLLFFICVILFQKYFVFFKMTLYFSPKDLVFFQKTLSSSRRQELVPRFNVFNNGFAEMSYIIYYILHIIHYILYIMYYVLCIICYILYIIW